MQADRLPTSGLYVRRVILCGAGSDSAVCSAPGFGSQFDLLCEGEGVLDLDAEVLDGTLDLGMAGQELDGEQVAGALLVLGCLVAPERMRAVAGAIEATERLPVLDQALVLSRSQMRAGMNAAREELVAIR